jgi:hypothetical protein
MNLNHSHNFTSPVRTWKRMLPHIDFPKCNECCIFISFHYPISITAEQHPQSAQHKRTVDLIRTEAAAREDICWQAKRTHGHVSETRNDRRDSEVFAGQTLHRKCLSHTLNPAGISIQRTRIKHHASVLACWFSIRNDMDTLRNVGRCQAQHMEMRLVTTLRTFNGACVDLLYQRWPSYRYLNAQQSEAKS